VVKTKSLSFFNYLVIEKGIKPYNAKCYTYTIDKFLKEHNEVNKDTIQNFYINYLNGNYSKSTIRNISFALNHFAKFNNIDLKIKPPVKNKAVTHYLTFDEVIIIFNSLKTNRDRAIFSLMAQIGLRVSEVVNLNIYDLRDLEKDIIYIKNTKNNIDNDVYITPDCSLYLHKYLIDERKSNFRPETPVFLSWRSNRRLLRNDVTRNLQHIGDSLGIKLYSHKCRHTSAMAMKKNGADIHDIQQQLRHENITSTLRYLHADKDIQRERFNQYKLKLPVYITDALLENDTTLDPLKSKVENKQNKKEKELTILLGVD